MPRSDLDGQTVSRETLHKLSAFENLVRHWSKRINLVSPSDLDSMWQRHIRDSAQLLKLSDRPDCWLDIGSGGGFPGLVVAILLRDRLPEARLTLVESDKRKCAFLKTAARSLELEVDILPSRIEDLQPLDATTLSARALAPLDRLLLHASRHLAPDGAALFPKGRRWKTELDQAKGKWSFECDVIQSITDTEAAVLRLRNIRRA